MSPANEIDGVIKESEERRRQAEGNTDDAHTRRAQSRVSVSQGLDRVRERAKAKKKEKFTSLLHLIDLERLKASYFALKRAAAPGVDGVTWEQYGQNLENNLLDLHRRIHRGAYRASASRRQYIPKSDGQRRPLGIAAIEDKVAQRAVVEVLNAIYERDFLGFFSYGFRPGRSQHDALDALAAGITQSKVNWIVDADIQSFFDSVSHEWLIRFVEHRVGDSRLLRLIAKWLKAGVMEEGTLTINERGTPQGAVASPLLANICLHYALDLWVEQWRRRHGHGDIIIVRYADDFVLGFEHHLDAQRFQHELRERLARFKLELHPEKTRLLRFGRFAAEQCRKRGESGAPLTFNFLGLTHCCSRSRQGKFLLQRHTMRARLTAKLREIKLELRRRLHDSIAEQGRWLGAVLRGHYAYYGVPTNIKALGAFRQEVTQCWRRSLRRRSQRRRLNWTRMHRLAVRWLPTARIVHLWPEARFDVRTRDKSPVR